MKQLKTLITEAYSKNNVGVVCCLAYISQEDKQSLHDSFEELLKDYNKLNLGADDLMKEASMFTSEIRIPARMRITE